MAGPCSIGDNKQAREKKAFISRLSGGQSLF